MTDTTTIEGDRVIRERELLNPLKPQLAEKKSPFVLPQIALADFAEAESLQLPLLDLLSLAKMPVAEIETPKLEDLHLPYMIELPDPVAEVPLAETGGKASRTSVMRIKILSDERSQFFVQMDVDAAALQTTVYEVEISRVIEKLGYTRAAEFLKQQSISYLKLLPRSVARKLAPYFDEEIEAPAEAIPSARQFGDVGASIDEGQEAEELLLALGRLIQRRARAIVVGVFTAPVVSLSTKETLRAFHIATQSKLADVFLPKDGSAPSPVLQNLMRGSSFLRAEQASVVGGQPVSIPPPVNFQNIPPVIANTEARVGSPDNPDGAGFTQDVPKADRVRSDQFAPMQGGTSQIPSGIDGASNNRNQSPNFLRFGKGKSPKNLPEPEPPPVVQVFVQENGEVLYFNLDDPRLQQHVSDFLGLDSSADGGQEIVGRREDNSGNGWNGGNGSGETDDAHQPLFNPVYPPDSTLVANLVDVAKQISFGKNETEERLRKQIQEQDEQNKTPLDLFLRLVALELARSNAANESGHDISLSLYLEIQRRIQIEAKLAEDGVEFDPEEDTGIPSSQDLEAALDLLQKNSAYNLAEPSGGLDGVDWSLAGGGNLKFNFDLIKRFYHEMQPGENTGAAIAQAAKFFVDNLGGLPQGDQATYMSFGVQTDRAWCMNFVNAVLHSRGLKPTGSDAAISALSLGNKVSFADVQPGDIVMRGDGHHVGIVVGRDARGNIIMANGNSGHTVRYSTVGPDYGVFIRHSGELDPHRPQSAATLSTGADTARTIADLKIPAPAAEDTVLRRDREFQNRLSSILGAPSDPQILNGLRGADVERYHSPGSSAYPPVTNFERSVPTMSWSSTPLPPIGQLMDKGDGKFTLARIGSSPGASGNVGLYIPNGFDPSKPAVMVPYMHGFGGGIMDATTRQQMDQWAKGRNVVFVVPQLGDHSDVRSGFDARAAGQFLSDASRALAEMYGRMHPDVSPDKFRDAFQNMQAVMMSYSGGYRATIPFLQQQRTIGVAALDTMYGNAGEYFKQFVKNGGFVDALFGDSTAGHTASFKAATSGANATVRHNPSSHGSLVQDAAADAIGRILARLGISDTPKQVIASGAAAPTSFVP